MADAPKTTDIATDAMLVAGKNSEWGWRDERGVSASGRIDCRVVWRSMLDASDVR